LKVIQQKFKVPVIDADLLGHSVYETGTAGYTKVTQTFGPSILDSTGNINRKLLGQLVFGEQNKGNMKKLTDIVWPQIAELAKNKILELQAAGERVIVLEGAVIVEAEWYKFLDELWVSTAPVEIAKARIMARNQLSEEEALKRISSQISNDERTKHASFVIDTNRPIEQTNELVTKKFSEILNKLSEHE